MFVKTKDKWTLIKAFINTWLKDDTKYCNWCGQVYTKYDFPCCENPQLGTNFDHTQALIAQNKDTKKERKNKFASGEGKNMRYCLSLPPKLVKDLTLYLKNECDGEKLFNDKKDVHKFMKKFPMFCIPRKV